MGIVETYEPTGILKPVADGVWIVDGPVIKFGYLGVKFPFPTRMTIVRLADGGLWVHSPTEISPALKSDVDALGPVRYLIAPNRIHYWWVEDWVAAYADALSYAAPGVRKKARSKGRFADYDADLAVDGEYPWSGELEMLLVPGSYLTEAVFFHQPTRTLVITDLIQNYESEKIANPVFRYLSRWAGAVDPDGQTPVDLRSTFFRHRKQMTEAVRTMISWQPQRIIIAHGRWYEENAVGELKRAFRWLPGISGNNGETQ
ncbi:MAG: DUF4336 domain-containing protein [Rhodospirillales bacterium]|nr:DUF4336 domain-containing protein [Rhodospirillales bacterium]